MLLPTLHLGGSKLKPLNIIKQANISRPSLKETPTQPIKPLSTINHDVYFGAPKKGPQTDNTGEPAKQEHGNKKTQTVNGKDKSDAIPHLVDDGVAYQVSHDGKLKMVKYPGR